MTGVSVTCVALFPSRTGLPQFLAATVAFVGMGVTALLAAAVIRGRFGYVSAVLGPLELVSFVLVRRSPMETYRRRVDSGSGGVERETANLIEQTTGFLAVARQIVENESDRA